MSDGGSYTIAIVGGGPAGINVAIAAEQAGLDYIILEKGYLVNSLYHFPTNMTFFSTSKNLEIGDVPFISHYDKPTRSEALEYYRRIADQYQLNIRYRTSVEAIRRQGSTFELDTTLGPIHADFVVVATGFYGQPRMLDIPGEDLPKVKHYYDDPHPYIDCRVAVIGAANSACDVALEIWQKGADVTMIVRGADIYEGVKYWIRPNIRNRIAEGSIKAYFNSTVTRIGELEIEVATPDGPLTLANDYVLAMTGYQPDYDLLRSFGIEIGSDEKKTPFYQEKNLESNVPGLYLCGVVLGGLHTSKFFIENTRDQGDLIIRDILLKTSIA